MRCRSLLTSTSTSCACHTLNSLAVNRYPLTAIAQPRVFIELIDLLRCIKPHEDTWLVASFRQVTNRIVLEGTLGCPICSAQYEISEGVVDFTGGDSIADRDTDRAHASHRREELATRAGAYLDATQPGTTIVLGGLWTYAAQDLAEMADVRVIALNAPSDVKETERVGLLRIAQRIPLASSSAHGVALDAWFNAASIDDALRVVRPAGRVVGPTSIPAAESAVVLAHDEHYWVGEKPPEMVSLRRTST